MLETLLQQRSASSPSENVQYQVRLLYASCLVREGNGAMMIPSLQATLAVLRAGPAQANDESRALLTLADAYDQAGRVNDARAALKAAVFASNASFTALNAVRGLYDIRIRADLLRTRSAALLASGNADGALKAAQEALQQSQRTDAPGSAATGSAQRALDAAVLAKTHSGK